MPSFESLQTKMDYQKPILSCYEYVEHAGKVLDNLTRANSSTRPIKLDFPPFLHNLLRMIDLQSYKMYSIFNTGCSNPFQKRSFRAQRP